MGLRQGRPQRLDGDKRHPGYLFKNRTASTVLTPWQKDTGSQIIVAFVLFNSDENTGPLSTPQATCLLKGREVVRAKSSLPSPNAQGGKLWSTQVVDSRQKHRLPGPPKTSTWTLLTPRSLPWRKSRSSAPRTPGP